MWLNSVWVVWRVSGWCLEGSWMMSGESLKLQRLYWCTNNYISSFQCNALHNAKIDRFGCAWKVSGRCFEDAQSNLDIAWRAILPKQLTKFQWRVPYFEVSLDVCRVSEGAWRLTNPNARILISQQVSSLPSWESHVPQNVCRVSGRCLIGVLGLSEWL